MYVEFFGVTFYKEKYSKLDTGETAVRFVEDGVTSSAFKVEATSSGVNFAGTLKAPIGSRKHLNDFAALIAEAWKEHLKLAPKISKNGLIE